jgi:hypothetical protein
MGTLLEEFGLQESCGQKHDVNMNYQKFLRNSPLWKRPGMMLCSFETADHVYEVIRHVRTDTDGTACRGTSRI